MDDKKQKTVEENLTDLLEKACNKRSLSVKEISASLSGKGRLLILVFLSLLFCQPLSIPGVSFFFGVLIVIIGFQMMLGKYVLLPKKIQKKTIPSKIIKKTIERILNILKKIQKFIYPRFFWFCKNSYIQKAHGLLIFLLGIFLAVPVPIPICNVLAGLAVFLISLGILKNDGLLILLGYVSSLIMVVVFFLLVEVLKSFF